MEGAGSNIEEVIQCLWYDTGTYDKQMYPIDGCLHLQTGKKSRA